MWLAGRRQVHDTSTNEINFAELAECGVYFSQHTLSGSPIPFAESSQTAGIQNLRLSFRIREDAVPGTYSLQAVHYKAGDPLQDLKDWRDRLFESQSVTFTVSQSPPPWSHLDNSIGNNTVRLAA